MKFKHSAFIENTPEMREWLEGLGYINKLKLKHPSPNLIITSDVLSQYALFYTSNIERNVIEAYPELIDCRNNPDLFKAVTAIREDSDYMQWFVDHLCEEWLLCNKEKYQDYVLLNDHVRYHKATLSELQEYFKSKQL